MNKTLGTEVYGNDKVGRTEKQRDYVRYRRLQQVI